MSTVLIVEDHAVVSHGLRLALEKYGHNVVAIASSLTQAQALLPHHNPDVVILDINLPDGSGFDLLLWIRSISKRIGVVVLSFNDETDFIKAARKGGANAYVVKSAPVREIIAAVDFSLASPNSFATSVVIAKEREIELTARELDILHLVAKGLSNVEIATQLFLSISTIKTHVSSILRKLESNNRVSAIKTAREIGLLS